MPVSPRSLVLTLAAWSLALPAAGSSAQRPAAEPEPVQQIIAAERTFAADTRARGAGASFRAAVAPDAVALLPDPATGVIRAVNARERIESRPATERPSEISWWPIFAGAAASGDLGFTTGPVIFPGGRGYGFIFTVWARQPDGSWRFHYDGGPPVDAAPTSTPETPVAILAARPFRAGSAAAATAEVRRAEGDLHQLARSDSRRAIRTYMTDETWLMGSGVVPTVGRREAGRELDRRDRAIEFTPLGMRAAASGDLVFSYGRARSGDRNGGYTRIWQRRSSGWRLVVDQLQYPAPRPS